MQVSITHARRCLLHMHAGVYDTCTQVSMILACRCLLHLLASHHSSEGNSDGYAIVYDTCTQVSMATACRCLWHMHANTLWSGWCYYNDTFGYIWLWFIDKLTPRLLAPQNFALQKWSDLKWWTDDKLMMIWWGIDDELKMNWWWTDPGSISLLILGQLSGLELRKIRAQTSQILSLHGFGHKDSGNQFGEGGPPEGWPREM